MERGWGPMKIEKILFYLGCLVIAVGVIGGIYQWASIDKDEYELMKSVYDEIPDNEYAEADFMFAESLHTAQVSTAFYTIIGSIIAGLLIIGFSTLISLVRELVEGNKKTNSYLDYFKVKPTK